MTHDASPRPAVGYKTPPVESRFKKGRSGNPLGRPRTAKNYGTILGSMLIKSFPGPRKRARRQSNAQMIVDAIFDKAIAGDAAAIKTAFALMLKYDTMPEPRVKIIRNDPITLEVIKRAAAGFPPMPKPYDEEV